MNTLLDCYPSRIADRPLILDRVEPVIHGPEGTETPGPISTDQLEEFDRQGFLLIDSLFSDDEVDAYLRELDRLGGDREVIGSAAAITEPNSQALRSLFAVHRDSEVFARLAIDPRLVGAARQILGSDVYVHQSRVNLKPALHGQEFFWHSDFETWHVEDGMPHIRAVSASVALTDNTEFNGPLMLVPGSHRWFIACVGETPERHHEISLRRQEIGTPDEESLRWLVDRGGIAAPKATRGSVVLFDCNTMHASGVNLSPAARSNAFFVYNSVENRVVAPFSGLDPRPEHIASRRTITPLG